MADESEPENGDEEEQTQYGGTEDQEPTTDIGDEDEDERAETDNEGVDK